MTGLVAFNNEFDNATTITASAAHADFPKENAYDWIPATQWKPGAAGSQDLEAIMPANTSVDFFGIAAHNLGTEGCTVTFQYSSNNGSTWNNFATAITPTDDSPILRYVTTPVNVDYYRILITNCTADAVIGVAAFGAALPLPQAIEPGSWAPAPFARKNTINTNISNKGVFMGRSIEQEGIDGLIVQNLVDPAWIRSNWLSFAQHGEQKPFFYSWNVESYEDEAGLYWGPSGFPRPEYMASNPLFMSFNIPLNGAY